MTFFSLLSSIFDSIKQFKCILTINKFIFFFYFHLRLNSTFACVLRRLFMNYGALSIKIKPVQKRRPLHKRNFHTFTNKFFLFISFQKKKMAIDIPQINLIIWKCDKGSVYSKEKWWRKKNIESKREWFLHCHRYMLYTYKQRTFKNLRQLRLSKK